MRTLLALGRRCGFDSRASHDLRAVCRGGGTGQRMTLRETRAKKAPSGASRLRRCFLFEIFGSANHRCFGQSIVFLNFSLAVELREIVWWTNPFFMTRSPDSFHRLRLYRKFSSNHPNTPGDEQNSGDSSEKQSARHDFFDEHERGND